MIGHRPGAGHPERPERLQAVLDALDDAGLSGDRRAATEAAIADLERLHPAAYVARLLNAAPREGLNQLDADTILSPGRCPIMSGWVKRATLTPLPSSRERAGGLPPRP